MSLKKLFKLWIPLAGTWMLVATEGPVLQGVMTRLGDPKLNLAAFGVALSIALLIESPIFMMMTASNTLVEDRTGYLKLRNFSFLLSLVLTALLLFPLSETAYQVVYLQMLDLSPDVAAMARLSTLLLAPAPFFVAHRRLYQGILISHHSTHPIGVGAAFRLAANFIFALGLGKLTSLSGAAIASSAISFGLVVNALLIRFFARDYVTKLLETEDHPDHDPLSYHEISKFYFPLALTTIIALSITPILTFFIARADMPKESLATLPVLNGIAFFFLSFLFPVQEVIISNIEENHRNFETLKRFTILLGTFVFLLQGLVLFTPAMEVLLIKAYNLPLELSDFTLGPAKLLISIPILWPLTLWQRAFLLHARITTPVTRSTLYELISTAAVMTIGIKFSLGSGLFCAQLAIVVGRTVGTLSLLKAYRSVLGLNQLNNLD